ncbi:MAG: phytoene desaturase family protein [Pirellulales bacterium]
MPEKSVLIIGAGLAGLATGCYARMNGYAARIFEHHGVSGGVCTAWKRGEFLVDGCIHFLTNHRPGSACHEVYRELGALEPGEVRDMTVYSRFVDQATERQVTITPDLDRLANDLAAVSPGDSAAIGDLVAVGRAMRGFDMAAVGFAKPPELCGLVDRLKSIWQMRRIGQYFGGNYAQSAAEFARALHDPWLGHIVENLFLPEVPVWFLGMLLGLLADGQLGQLESGSLAFSQAIERRFRELGGEITCRATVEEILVENGRAVGVRLADGSLHRGDVVVSAADGYSTIFKLLGGRYLDRKIEARFRDWKPIPPLVMVSLGVAREFPAEPSLTILNLSQPFDVGPRTIRSLGLRIMNYTGRFAPPGKTVVQAIFQTTWDWWNDLSRDRAAYRAEKQRVAAEVLRRLEGPYPGISAQVEMSDVATPYTTWRFTLNRQGAYEGWLPTHQAMVTRVEKTLPGLANFYMAGQWVMPGGGVLPCLYSGRHVVQILCHRDRKPFQTTTAHGGKRGTDTVAAP